MRALNKIHSGQVALLMVLIMTVLGAMAVTMASRLTLETRVQQTSVENTQAMLAATTGLEQAVGKGTSITGALADGQSYSVTLNSVGTSGIVFEKANPGETTEVNLVGSSGTLSGVKVYWNALDPLAQPSIFVSDVGSDRIIDYGYDSTGINGFLPISTTGTLNGIAFNHVSPTINISPGTSRSIRITVLGGGAIVGVAPVGSQFPPQINSYLAVGNVGTGETQVKYGIEYQESATDQIPSVFDYALFSAGSIIQ